MSFLFESFNSLKSSFPKIAQVGEIRDNIGIYALVISSNDRISYFVAKKSMAGKTVSVHAELLEKAKKEHRNIVMAVGHSFFVFYPWEIESPPAYNSFWKGILMTNFNIDLGLQIGK